MVGGFSKPFAMIASSSFASSSSQQELSRPSPLFPSLLRLKGGRSNGPDEEEEDDDDEEEEEEEEEDVFFSFF